MVSRLIFFPSPIRKKLLSPAGTNNYWQLIRLNRKKKSTFVQSESVCLCQNTALKSNRFPSTGMPQALRSLSTLCWSMSITAERLRTPFTWPWTPPCRVARWTSAPTSGQWLPSQPFTSTSRTSVLLLVCPMKSYCWRKEFLKLWRPALIFVFLFATFAFAVSLVCFFIALRFLTRLKVFYNRSSHRSAGGPRQI